MANTEIEKLIFCAKNNTGLTRFCDSHLDGGYQTWFSDFKVNQFNSHWVFPKSKAELEKYVSDLNGDTSKIVFAIHELENYRHIGNISIQAIDLINRNAELAFLLGDTRYWGKGHAYRAAILCLQHCFDYLNLKRVYLGCMQENQAMNKLAKKLGFCKEGVRRKAIFSAGKYSDVVEYGILEDEFKKSSIG